MDDSEVILKGSALYDYLHQTGFSNFESYEVKQGNSRWFPSMKENSQFMQIAYPVPQWVIDHLNCILKSGLLLEDHRHFIECYYPLQAQNLSTPMHHLMLFGAPFFCLFGGLWKFSRIPVPRLFFFAALGTSCLLTIFGTKKILIRRSESQAISRLTLSLLGLEKVYVQLKKMLLLVHQNEFIAQNGSLRQREIKELKKKLQEMLLGAIHKLFHFLDVIKEVPLSVDVDETFQSFSLEDIFNRPDQNQDDSCSFEDLKKLFNSYILLQSEFLRRFALCYCPDIWNHLTSKAALVYSKRHLPEILKWSCYVQETLIQEQRFFRAVLESKDKQSHLKSSSSSWDYADVYVSVRSASIHFQSLLIQIQALQDILENEEYEQSKSNNELLNTIAHMLLEITKEIHSGQGCIDASSVQIYKMISALQPLAKVSEPELVSLSTEDSDGLTNSAVNPPVEDEVFELTVPEGAVLLSDEDEWDHTITTEYNINKKKQVETSKRVLQELKTVLVKKAEEWKERERRAMEVKGIVYTAPEQVRVNLELPNVSSNDNLLDFLPTNCQNMWPLPRLKGSLQPPRLRGKKVEHSKTRSSFRISALKLPVYTAENAIKGEPDKENQTLKVGFGASLLAEAMAKSKSMHNSRREDVFVDSADESSSGE